MQFRLPVACVMDLDLKRLMVKQNMRSPITRRHMYKSSSFFLKENSAPLL